MNSLTTSIKKPAERSSCNDVRHKVLPALIIVFREVFETGLIVGIMLAGRVVKTFANWE
jgi:hypothetical protein